MKVYGAGGFSGWHTKYERAGTPLSVNIRFQYEDCEWLVPAVYICREYLVADLVRLIPRDALRHFADRWYTRLKDDPEGKGLTQEERLLSEAENPLISFPSFWARINGKETGGEGWCGTGWQRIWKNERCPDFEAEMRELREEYGLGNEDGWYCYRARFCWPDGKKEELKELYLTIKPGRTEYPCGCYFTTEAGCRPFEAELTHPVTGTHHKINILSCEEEQIPEQIVKSGMDENKWIYPRKYQVLRYTVLPDIPNGDQLQILDRDHGDSPVQAEKGKTSGAAAIGIIGGASGAAVIETGKKAGETKKAFSSLHFQPVPEINWYVCVSVCPLEPVTVKII